MTGTHRLWQTKETPMVGTPVYHEGHLYWIGRKGVAMCVRAVDGEVIWEESIDMEGSGDKIYAFKGRFGPNIRLLPHVQRRRL